MAVQDLNVGVCNVQIILQQCVGPNALTIIQCSHEL